MPGGIPSSLNKTRSKKKERILKFFGFKDRPFLFAWLINLLLINNIVMQIVEKVQDEHFKYNCKTGITLLFRCMEGLLFRQTL